MLELTIDQSMVGFKLSLEISDNLMEEMKRRAGERGPGERLISSIAKEAFSGRSEPEISVASIEKYLEFLKYHG